MRQETKEIIKLTAKEIFFTFFDVVIVASALGAKTRYQRREFNRYFEDRYLEREDLSRKISYLRKRGLINCFVEKKEKYIELTQKGKKELVFKKLGDLVTRTNKWDGFFRVVMFDVPEDDKKLRDIIRQELERIGFRLMQKSVFVYPFDCKLAIDALCYFCDARRYLKYMVANIIEGEDEFIETFLDAKILTENDLSK